MNYEFFMKKCIELAHKAEGKVSPNPLVGAIVTDDNGNIISTGYHKKYGDFHAEKNALDKAGEKAKGKILFCNLEPCNHYGKNPPCTKAIIESGIKKVIVGCKDTNPKAKGGIEELQSNGIEVIDGILEKESQKLNEIFFTNIEKKRPFIAIKSATTLDGKIATQTGSSKWITSEASRMEVQKLRNKYDAIITSSKTILKDNPSLTCRMDGGRNPIKIIVDKDIELTPNLKIFDGDEKVIIACAQNADMIKTDCFRENVEFIPCPLKFSHIDLEFLIKKLYEQKICSILCESGGTFAGALLQTGLVDKIYQFVAPKILGDKKATGYIEGYTFSNINDCLKLNVENVKMFGDDILFEMYTK